MSYKSCFVICWNLILIHGMKEPFSKTQDPVRMSTAERFYIGEQGIKSFFQSILLPEYADNFINAGFWDIEDIIFSIINYPNDLKTLFGIHKHEHIVRIMHGFGHIRKTNIHKKYMEINEEQDNIFMEIDNDVYYKYIGRTILILMFFFLKERTFLLKWIRRVRILSFNFIKRIFIEECIKWKSLLQTAVNDAIYIWMYFHRKQMQLCMFTIDLEKNKHKTTECTLWICSKNILTDKLYRCKCKSVRYCSKKHQKIHWKLKHSDQCACKLSTN
eukprot:437824_1